MTDTFLSAGEARLSNAGTMQGSTQAVQSSLLLSRLSADDLVLIMISSSPDDLLAAALSCRSIDRARRAAKLPLRTCKVSTLRSESLSLWATRIGCPSPFPCWAYTHGLKKTPELNDKVARVQKPLDKNGRHEVRMNARLVMQKMIRDPTRGNWSGPDDAQSLCTKGVRMKPDNLTLLTAKATATVLIFVYDAMLPRQRTPIPSEAQATIQAALSQCSDDLGFVPRMGMVGPSDGACPFLCGAEVTLGELPCPQEGGSRCVPTITAHRPFEVLELLPHGTAQQTRRDMGPITKEEQAFAPQLQSPLFEGRLGTFVAKVRWIPVATDTPAPRTMDDAGRVQIPDPQATRQELAELCAQIRPKVDTWLRVVRSTGREKFPSQLDAILADLGGAEPRERPKHPGELALWVAALVNPLPALGVAPEVRGRILEDINIRETVQAVKMAHWVLTSSIQNMQGLRAPRPEW